MNKSSVEFETRATRTYDLSQSEWRFLVAMNELDFGRFDLLRIEHGELVLHPGPTTVRYVKLASKGAVSHKGLTDDFELACSVVELFEHVRAIDRGEILVLEARHSRPFSMEIDYQRNMNSVG